MRKRKKKRRVTRNYKITVQQSELLLVMGDHSMWTGRQDRDKISREISRVAGLEILPDDRH